MKIFVKLEERNYSLLVFVNLLNREIEVMSRRNRMLDSQFSAFKAEEEEAEKRKEDLLGDFKAHINKVTREIEQDKLEEREVSAEIEKLAPHVHV